MKLIRYVHPVLACLLLIGFVQSGFAQQQDFPAASPDNALEHYVHLEDGAFAWELKESSDLGNVTVYQLLLTSQEWRGDLWRHQLSVFVPDENRHEGALLLISGGSNKNEQPNWSKEDRMWPAMAAVAENNQAIVSMLKQTPNQPLYGERTEDELISYTLHNYKADKDPTWPLLFPMVKSALKAMDAIQAFAAEKLDHKVENFLMAGASKRGWTTWLTAATGDPRVKAIAPMVIDILNMPVNLQYQLDSYGEYSEQIQDYVKLGIVQGIETEEGRALATMIDPYSYRKKLTVPKMIFIGTNDEYWTVDAIKHYYDDIPGKNMIHYVPNVGHNLGGGKQVLESLSTFFALTLSDGQYPVVSWRMRKGQGLTEFSFSLDDPNLIGAVLWSASSQDRDFRDEKWRSRRLKNSGSNDLTLIQKILKRAIRLFMWTLYTKTRAEEPIQ